MSCINPPSIVDPVVGIALRGRKTPRASYHKHQALLEALIVGNRLAKEIVALGGLAHSKASLQPAMT